jgi:hypothetical protein
MQTQPSPAMGPVGVPTSLPSSVSMPNPDALPTSAPNYILDSETSVPSDVFTNVPTDGAPNTPGASPPFSIAPTSAPTAARNSMAGENPPVNKASHNNTGIIVGSVVGVLVAGMLLGAAIWHVKHPHAPVPPTVGDTRPTAPPSDIFPATPAMTEVPPPPALPAAMAVPIDGHKVLFKDQCRSVAVPPSVAPTAGLLPPPVARVAEPVTTDGGDWNLPVARLPSSARRPPPRDP